MGAEVVLRCYNLESEAVAVVLHLHYVYLEFVYFG